MASAVAAALMAGVMTAAGAAFWQLRQSEQVWNATNAVSQVLDQWRTFDAAGAQALDGSQMSVDDAGALTEAVEGFVPAFTIVVRTSVPTGWPPGAVRVEACAYRGEADLTQRPLICLQSGVRGVL